MSLKLLKITTPRVYHKRFCAVFEDNGKKIVTHFGSNTHTTYIDHQKKDLRMKYLSDYDNSSECPTSEQTLTRWILWGEHPRFGDNLLSFKKKFDL